MVHFPGEFSQLLSQRGRAACSSNDPHPEFVTAGHTPLLVLREVIPRQTSNGCIALLDQHLLPVMKRMASAIPPESIWGMRHNYSERLPKTMRVWTAELNARNSKPVKAAKAIGLVEMLRSPSLRHFAESVTGHQLDPHCSMQVICYENGDYSGPHNDHHPEQPHLRDGYVDLHIMFSNPGVKAQYLVYERDGYLTETVDVACHAAIAVYRLPFWHQVTPLVARKGQEDLARRWLLLASFAISG